MYFYILGCEKKPYRRLGSPKKMGQNFPSPSGLGGILGGRHGILGQKIPRKFGSLFAPENMGVSKNRGTKKWMVYNGNPY